MQLRKLEGFPKPVLVCPLNNLQQYIKQVEDDFSSETEWHRQAHSNNALSKAEYSDIHYKQLVPGLSLRPMYCQNSKVL